MNVRDTDVFSLMLIRMAGLPLWWPEEPNDTFGELETQYETALLQVKTSYQLAAAAFEQDKDRPISDKRLEKILTNGRRFFRSAGMEKDLNVDHYLVETRPDLASLLADFHSAKIAKALTYKALQAYYATRLFAEKRMLIDFASNEVLRRALLFSSHSLLHELPGFADSDPEQWNKNDRRTASALLKYALRATTKTTPFSRLSVVALQYPGMESDPLESVFESVKPVVTPNVGLLPLFYEVLMREKSFYQNLPVRLNPSLQTTEVGEEWLYFDGEQESFQHMKSGPALQRLKACFPDPTDAVPFSRLIAGFSAAMDAQPAEVEPVLFKFIDFGYLEWVFPEPGLTAGWCGSLYNFLGFLPSSPVITDAAFLLQWLRTAARTLSFQSISAAQDIQMEAVSLCRAFFEKHELPFPNIPAEQIFYEDVAVSVQSNVPQKVFQTVLNDLGSALKNASPHRVYGLRGEIMQAGKQLQQPGEALPFLSFCKLFLENKSSAPLPELYENQSPVNKTGALLQFYRTEKGEYRAVLNALYPGGGKMMARWLHLFPASVTEQLKSWWPENTIAFPWQHWSNANFQPRLAQTELYVPGGRTGAQKGGISLRNLVVFRDNDTLGLMNGASGQRVIFTDAGLDAPDTRPPVIQILWHLGVPFISAGIFSDPLSEILLEEGVVHQKRVEYKSIVLNRANWHIAAGVWSGKFPAGNITEPEAFVLLRKTLSGWNIPRYFFAGFKNESSRFFDQNSPMLMQEFKKMTEKGVELALSEMLPTPEQWVAEANGELRAAEWAVEWRTTEPQFGD